MSDTHSHRWPGIPLALGSAVLFGASAPLSKLLIGSVDPWLLAGILYLGAGVGLAIVRASREVIGLPSAEAPLARGDLKWLAAIITFGGVLGPLFLMLGLAQSTASSAALLLNLEGLATMTIAWIVFKENVDRRLLLGAAAILIGALLISWNGSAFQFQPGSLFIAAACLCWGIDNNLTRKLSGSDPVQIAMIKGLVAGSTNVAIALALGAAVPSLTSLAAGAILGFFGIGVSLVMFMLGLRHLGTARTGAYFSSAPFIGAVLAILLFREAVTIQLGLAGALMAVGLWLHLSERHDHDHQHIAMDHDHLHTHDVHHQHHHDDEPVSGPHSHPHHHDPMRHKHPHFPDIHHRHRHS